VPQKEWNVADNVALALESEAPHSLLSADADLKENIVPFESQPTPQKAKRSLPGWLSHLGQISIAASVCLAVVIGIQHSRTSGVESPSQQALPILQTVPLAGVAEPVSLTRDSVRKQTVDINKQEQRRRINALLQDYELQLRLNSDTNLNQTKNQKSVVE
jgi:sigma-E factor negative regulatory protein RseA